MWFVRAALAPIHGAAAAFLRADVLHPSRLNNIIFSCEDSQEDGASDVNALDAQNGKEGPKFGGIFRLFKQFTE